MNILVIEDDRNIADFLQRGLRAEGYGVVSRGTGEEGLAAARAGAGDLIILDLMLPDTHGLDVCQQLRAEGRRTPILVLTALGALEDKVDGLRLGADDYVTKPFAFEELLARIEALLRRANHMPLRQTRIVVGDLSFDRDSLEVRRGDRAIELTAKELALLELLMVSHGKVVSRTRILGNVWGCSTDPLTNIVDVYIRRLRSKLEADGDPPLIRTIRGVGYRLGATRDGGDIFG